MYRTLLSSISGIVLSTSALYIILTSSVSQNPSLIYTLPFVVGLFLMFLYVFVRSLFIKSDLNKKTLFVLYRQGLLLALVAAVALILQGFRVLTLLDAILISAAAILFELFFQSEKSDFSQKE